MKPLSLLYATQHAISSSLRGQCPCPDAHHSSRHPHTLHRGWHGLSYVHRERPLPPCLDHELTRQGVDRRGLQWPQLHCPIQGISWHNLHTPDSSSALLVSSTCQTFFFNIRHALRLLGGADYFQANVGHNSCQAVQD